MCYLSIQLNSVMKSEQMVVLKGEDCFLQQFVLSVGNIIEEYAVSYHLDVIPNGILGVYLGSQFKLPDFFHFSFSGTKFLKHFFLSRTIYISVFLSQKKMFVGQPILFHCMPICKVVLRLSSAVEKFYRHFSLLENIFLSIQWKNCPSLCSY